MSALPHRRPFGVPAGHRTITLSPNRNVDPETLKIASDETELGYLIINKSDFDPKSMKKYVEKKSEPKPNDPPQT